MWSDIFEDWPKAESNNGTRTYEFLPSFQTFQNATHQYQIPLSLDNVTYITWEDNRSCDKFIWHSGSYIIMCHIWYVKSYPLKMSKNFRRWPAGMFCISLVFKLIRYILFECWQRNPQFENLSKSMIRLIALITVIMKLLIALVLNGDTAMKVATKILILDVMKKLLVFKYANKKRLCHWMVIFWKISISYQTLI